MMEKLINYILMQSQRTFMCFAIFKSDIEIRLNLSVMFKDNKRSNKCIGGIQRRMWDKIFREN